MIFTKSQIKEEKSEFKKLARPEEVFA